MTFFIVYSLAEHEHVLTTSYFIEQATDLCVVDFCWSAYIDKTFVCNIKSMAICVSVYLCGSVVCLCVSVGWLHERKRNMFKRKTFTTRKYIVDDFCIASSLHTFYAAPKRNRLLVTIATVQNLYYLFHIYIRVWVSAYRSVNQFCCCAYVFVRRLSIRYTRQCRTVKSPIATHSLDALCCWYGVGWVSSARDIEIVFHILKSEQMLWNWSELR